VLDFFARWYASKLQHRLGRMGLTYHDAIAETGVHEKALSRMPPEYLLQRNRRLKRAFDLSQKHAELPPSMQESAFREFDKVQAVFAQTQKDSDERAAINDGAFDAADERERASESVVAGEIDAQDAVDRGRRRGLVEKSQAPRRASAARH